jgi:multiple sugar transport system substrate-binding protein
MACGSRRWMVGALILGLAVALAVPATAQVKIRFQTWHWGEKPWVNALDAFKDDFNKANPGIEVVRDESRYADKETVYTATSQAKAAADIAHFQHRPIPMFAERGYLLPLDAFIEKEGGQKFLAQYDQSALEVCKYKGKIYCLPDFVNPMGMLINMAHYKEVGLDPTKPAASWDQLVEYAKKLTTGSRYGIGLIGSRQEGLFMRLNPFIWGAGGEYLTPDGKRSAMDTPEFLEGFKFYVELFTKHKVVPPGVIEQGAQEVRTQVAHEKVSMNISVPQAWKIVQAINPNMKVLETLTAVPVPAGPKKKVTAAEYGMRVISAYTKNPEAAWKVYKYWYGHDIQLRNFQIAAVLSARLDVKNGPEMQNDKYAKVYSAQAQFAKLEPRIPEWPKIGDAVITAVQEAFSGIKTPEQALKDAHASANRTLSGQ